ncbi:hypothetical protein [Enterococcus faecium]|uniref:hypothetical protein n=1 Tax=Enterococcus faecium TaxID=1352 RepID=UPI0011B011A1|nr:hypothetical protein [Enterococcus faecium]
MNHRQVSRSWYKLADEFNRSFGTHYSWEKIRSHYRRNLEREVEPMSMTRAGETVLLKENGEQISQIKIAMTREESKDPDYLLEAHGYSSEHWVVKSAVSNIWDGQSAEGPRIMYQSKITVAPKKQSEMSLKEMIELVNNAVMPIELPKAPITEGMNNLVIPVSDLHFGITTMLEVLPYYNKIVEVIGGKVYNEIHIVQLGDVIHSDSAVRGQTTKGTRITDINIEKALGDATTFFDLLINFCYDHSNKLFFHAVAGNHDTTTGFMFMKILEQRYLEYAEWDVALQWRTAFKMGGVMIGATHGDFVKNKEVITFAGEYPELWDASERYILTGHLHHKKVTDVGAFDTLGVTILQQSTIKPADEWEIKNGYTLSKKEITLYEFDIDKMIAEYHIKK